MSVRQYIGARYITKIYENTLDPSSAEWQASVNYEPLTMVTYNNGSYLSKKQVPASVGDPASNPTYWAQTGFYNGQISGLQAQIDEINNTLYIVGPSAKYQTITAAYNDCVANGGGTVLITEGIYDEEISGGVVSVPVTFLGTDRKKSIWQSSVGGYDHACFTGSGNITFENLTLYKKAPASQTTQGAYALHMDYPGAEGKMAVINCDVISEENAAIGCGTRTNQEIDIENCLIICDLKNGIASTSGSLLYHTAGTASQTGQKFTMRNCELRSNTTCVNITNSAANTENVPLVLIDNKFYSSDVNFLPTKLTYENAFGFVDDTGTSHFDYTINELRGNNCQTLNASKFDNLYGNATKLGAGYGFFLTDDLLTSDLVNCFVIIPSTGTEKPGGYSHDFYGFIIGYGVNYKTAIVVDTQSYLTYKKTIRGGSVTQDWTEIDFGVVSP